MHRNESKESLELELRERIKELEGLYALNRLATEALPLAEVFAILTRDIIPPSMQYPDKVFSKIILDRKTYSQCRNIERETENFLTYAIVINGVGARLHLHRVHRPGARIPGDLREQAHQGIRRQALRYHTAS